MGADDPRSGGTVSGQGIADPRGPRSRATAHGRPSGGARPAAFRCLMLTGAGRGGRRPATEAMARAAAEDTMRLLDSARDCLARLTMVVEVSGYGLGCSDEEGLLSERQPVACATQTAVARAVLTAAWRSVTAAWCSVTAAWPGLAQGIPLPVGPTVVLADLEGKLEGAQGVEVIDGAVSVFRELDRAVYCLLEDLYAAR
ncbi:hypothetical protein CLOM_g16361 [Closterium sp. NIES-68]|nr:hypothetical protein CLOM_g16361 [Closterium sp. NIES-68]GJP80397.1 hypothetical protein CLOP_g10604 [Closterium sp. NIES-67]